MIDEKITLHIYIKTTNDIYKHMPTIKQNREDWWNDLSTEWHEEANKNEAFNKTATKKINVTNKTKLLYERSTNELTAKQSTSQEQKWFLWR